MLRDTKQDPFGEARVFVWNALTRCALRNAPWCVWHTRTRARARAHALRAAVIYGGEKLMLMFSRWKSSAGVQEQRRERDAVGTASVTVLNTAHQDMRRSERVYSKIIPIYKRGVQIKLVLLVETQRCCFSTWKQQERGDRDAVRV